MAANLELPTKAAVLTRYYELAAGDLPPQARIVSFDKKREEIANPKILTVTKLERTIAQRGLWNHLAVVRRVSPKVSMEALDTVEAAIDGSMASMQTLQRAYDWTEDTWNGQAVFDDEDVMAELIKAKLADEFRRLGDWMTRVKDADRKQWLADSTIEEFYSLTNGELARRARILNARQAVRRAANRDEFATIVDRFDQGVYHVGLIKLARAIREADGEEEA